MPSHFMERAGRVIAKLKLPAGTISPEQLACRGWVAAVGKRIAARARAVTLRDHKLVVEVDDAVWQGHLKVLERQILDRLEEVIGPGIVQGIEYWLAVPRRLPQFAAEPDFRASLTRRDERARSGRVQARRPGNTA
ncbi:MAG: DUF721 domain-containing protein [Bryobacteraceae bacterium]|nr:DUF721 domain-containing protein [Bryobacteraceae bacterium]